MATITDAADFARDGSDVVVVASSHEQARELLDAIARVTGVERVSFANGLERVDFAGGGCVRFGRQVSGTSADHVLVPADRMTVQATYPLFAAGVRVHELQP